MQGTEVHLWGLGAIVDRASFAQECTDPEAEEEICGAILCCPTGGTSGLRAGAPLCMEDSQNLPCQLTTPIQDIPVGGLD